jgi:hypothetical protein
MLYKYITTEGIICLENQMIKVTPPNKFNDPFEFIPKIEGYSSKEETISYLMKDEILKEYYDEAIERKVTSKSFIEFKNEIHNNINDYTDSIINHSSKKNVQWNLAKEFLDDVSRLVAVYCLSKCCSNLLMWSHYAEYHTGIVVGLETNDDFFHNSNGIYDVDYVKNRPIYNQSWWDYSEQEKKFIAEIISKKYEVWSYEQETRVVFNLSKCKKIENNSNHIYLKDFLPSLIKEVILGCRCSPNTINRVKQILNEDKYSHTVLKKAYLDSNKYKLIIRRIRK